MTKNIDRAPPPQDTPGAQGRPSNNAAALPPVEIDEGAFCVDGAMLGRMLDVQPADVPSLMREGAITSVCERGTDDHAGQYRLSFFYGSRRARVSIDETGRILRRSVIDFGTQPLPQSAHRPG